MSARETPPPLPPALAELVDAERPLPPLDDVLASQLFARIDASLVDAGLSHGEHPEDLTRDAPGEVLEKAASGAAASAGGAGAAKVAAATSALGLASKALVAKVAVGVALVTAGGVGGVAVAPVVRPQPERVVYVTRTVRVLVPSEPVAPVGPAVVTQPTPDVVTGPTNTHVTVQHPTNTDTVPTQAAAERLLIERARTAVQGERWEQALEALRQHEQRFPRGADREERDALRVEALAGAGRTAEAGALARRFFGQYPGSIYAPRLRSVTQE